MPALDGAVSFPFANHIPWIGLNTDSVKPGFAATLPPGCLHKSGPADRPLEPVAGPELP